MIDQPNQKPPEHGTSEHGPNVFTFPPVIYAGAFIMGYLTDRGFPNNLGFETPRQIVGWSLVVLGCVLAGWAIARFVQARTHVDVRKPATSLVTDGPYRLTRNPMYVAAALLYAGVAIVYAKIFILAFLVPCLIVIDIFIIRREEAYLEALFGEPYREFCGRVRRWL